MDFQFGKNIRKFRRRAGVTQETLGNALGLSAQAISRWEAGGGYPDMQLVPAIASYFGITIDELFGYNSDRSLRIAEICNQYDDMERRQVSFETMFDFIRLAAEEFPASDEIMIRYANALYEAGWQERGVRAYNVENSVYAFNDSEYGKQNEVWQDAISILTNLLMQTGNPAIREQAVCLLVYLYRNTGQYEEATMLACQQPTLASSRELLLLQGTDGAERARYAGEALISLTRIFSDVLSMTLSGRVDLHGTTLYIQKIQGIIDLYQLIYEDSVCGYAHYELCELYLTLARAQWVGDFKEETFESLNMALVEARKFDAMKGTGEYHYTASLLCEVSDNTYAWPIDRTVNRAETLSDALQLSEEFCPGLKADERFKRWKRKTKYNRVQKGKEKAPKQKG
ncbi:MAG: helix-turn-helix transcriptional regulator [Clostridiales bacterium]|nr:helix-turn-helix transcriptional regulator [Clostridiales bacterium]